MHIALRICNRLLLLFLNSIIVSPGGITRRSNSYTATYLPSRKLSKLDEPDMQDTAGEAKTSSYVMFSYGPPLKGRDTGTNQHTAALWGHRM